jgi:hypothetical protein
VSPDHPPVRDEDRPTERADAEERPGGDEGSPPVAAPPPPIPPEPPPAPGLPLGRLIVGLALVAVGVIWLLGALDVVSFSLLAVLPAALIVVGIVLIGAARTGRHGGLVVLGIVLTVILTIASSFDIRLQGGVGDRIERPATGAEVEKEYHLSVGQLTLDLRGTDFSVAGPTTVKASVGIGQLTVRVPDDLLVEANGHVGAGQVTMFGRQNSGLDVKLFSRSTPAGFLVFGSIPSLTLDLSVGLGQIEVTR